MPKPTLERLVPWLVFFLLGIGLWACGGGGSDSGGIADSGDTPVVRFAVLTDPHLYDPEFGTSGEAFAESLASDRLLVGESAAIFAKLTELLAAEDPPEFLLIPGDLTRDGERQSHELLVTLLNRLTEVGIRVFVIPGNHDIANPAAFSYSEMGREPVESLSAEEFVTFYAPFGYTQALARDPHSLSYIVEPSPGYWLFAIDSCRYDENEDAPVIGGYLKEETRAWLKEQLREARRQNKIILAMMHHPLVEHALGQGEYLPEFLLENWRTVGPELAAEGLRLIFTGHFHAQKITRKDWDNGDFLLEVQTGALSAWPNPYRRVVYAPETESLTIETRHIEDINGFEAGEAFADFATYAEAFSREKMTGLLEARLDGVLALSEAQKETYLPLLATAAQAFFKGDQAPTLSTFRLARDLSESPDEQESLIGLLLLSLWHNIPPADNDLNHLLVPK
jgi:3',5'-cyclic AMP phosphodiesterase CpdA